MAALQVYMIVYEHTWAYQEVVPLKTVLAVASREHRRGMLVMLRSFVELMLVYSLFFQDSKPDHH